MTHGQVQSLNGPRAFNLRQTTSPTNVMQDREDYFDYFHHIDVLEQLQNRRLV